MGKWRTSVPIKEPLLLLFFVLEGAQVATRVRSLGVSGGLIVYAALFLGLTVALVAASRIARGEVRWILAVLLYAAALFQSASERIIGDHLTYDAFLNLMGSAGFVGDATAQYGSAMIVAALCCLPLLLAIGLPPRRRSRFQPLLIAAPLIGTVALGALLYVRGGEGGRGLPGPYPTLAYFSLMKLEQLTEPQGAREPVSIAPVAKPTPGDLVLIIDESVAAAYLDLAGLGGVRSGLLQPRAGVSVVTFGVAASITHCSVGTNLTLRHGGTREGYARLNATGPAIWAYAQRAGYRTVYLDAQRTDGSYQNGMDAAEAREIDSFVQLDGVSVRERDQVLARRLAALLANGTREFILVNKMGAHFPVHDKYPDAFAHHQPALSRGKFTEVGDTGSRDGFAGGAEGWRRYRNAYRNTLEWNVGTFFDTLLASGTLNRATILYTSDHGQDLHERRATGLNTHCSADPAPAEGAVPLAILTGAQYAGWQAAATRNRNAASHYQIFPTLLVAMGYAPAEVRARYGATLADPLQGELRFNALFNARLGRDPEWRAIDIAALPRPPVRDDTR